MFDIFNLPDFTLPEDFLLGSATAPHQIEGDNVHSGHWKYEQEEVLRNPKFQVSGKACNHYNMVDEDVKLLAALGHKAYRMGVEWARIEPQEGVFDKAATAHYVHELELLKKNGIKTFVTLVHFSMPLWFEEKNGFFDLDNFAYFERYLRYILPIISPYVDFWNVFNEFNLGTTERFLNRKFNKTICHARAYRIIKEYSSAPVSSAHALLQYYGARQSDPFDTALQGYLDAVDNEFFFHAIRTGELVVPGKDGIYDKEIKGTCDFWSINLYVRQMVDARKAKCKTRSMPYTHMQMISEPFYLEEFWPETMFNGLTRCMDKPVYITENGCCCDNDDFRIIYIAEFLSALNAARQTGVDVRGYLYWSFMDNYEWSSYAPRFGMVGVDRQTFVRTPKPSAYFYKEIIENKAFKQDILRKYLKSIPTLKK